MIPSRTWFPGSLQERAGWFQNFDTQMQLVGASLGFSALELTEIAADNDVIQFLASTAIALEAYMDGVRGYRIEITEGTVGEPTPGFPASPALVLPAGVPTGIFQRLDDNVKRIRVAKNYTPEIGGLLQIIPSKPDPISPGDLKPVIKAGASAMGYKFELNVTRLGQEAFKVQILRNGNGNWVDNGFATNNPCEVTVTPTTPGQPERVQVRAILLEKNEPVGQPSDPTYVTVNP